MTIEARNATSGSADDGEPRPSFFKRISGVFSARSNAELVVPKPTPQLLQSDVRIVAATQQFELTLGNVSLEFQLDQAITGEADSGNREWIVHQGSAFYEGVPVFIRIRPGDEIVFGRTHKTQTRLFAYDPSVAERHVKISSRKGDLTVQILDPDRTTSLSTIASPRTACAARLENLRRLPDILGRPLVPFNDEEALEVIRDVNAILADEVYRDRNDEGAPGGIIKFPDDMNVLIMGDIHARIDNVLRVITEGGTLGALERGEACLVFLGDLIHSEEKGKLEDMESSVLILDLFCMLKRRFPENVFYVHGNHESFSPEVGKGGVPQGLLLRKQLKQLRGIDYVNEVETLFEGLAYIVYGNEFAACHGGPVRSRVTRNTLVNIHRYPGLQSEIVWNRLRHGNRPVGYGKGSVKRFRQLLNLSKKATLVVGHTPMSAVDTFWRDIGGIAGHHIVYSAHTHRLAAMLMHDGHATALEFIPEPALALLNGEARI
jgi:predicted phosphodiesterase